MTAYMLTGQVGDHQEGEVITYTDQQLKDGHDPERLVRLGVAREATADEEKRAVVYGNSSSPTLKPIPQVPFEAAEPQKVHSEPKK